MGNESSENLLTHRLWLMVKADKLLLFWQIFIFCCSWCMADDVSVSVTNSWVTGFSICWGAPLALRLHLCSSTNCNCNFTVFLTWWKWQTSEAILLCALWQLALSLMVHRHHLLHYWSDNIHRILKIILKGWTKLSCTRVWRDQTIWMLLMNISWHWLVADRLLKIIYGTQAYTLHPPNWDIVKKTFLFCPCRNLWSVFIKIICDIQYIPHIMAL